MAPVAQRDREQLSMLENKRAMYETITMNYRQKVQRLTRLQDMDPDLLLKEIDQPWPGMGLFAESRGELEFELSSD